MRLLSALLMLLAASQASAAPSSSTQAATPASPAPATQSSQPAPAPAEPAGTAPYNYNVDGRRDPFQSLTTGDTKTAPKPVAAGIAGIRVDELAVRGIMQSRERLVAMVQGPDNRTYLIHQGDKLADGMVKSITPKGLVLVQDVSDPHAKDKTREVRKLLRTPEDDKE